jgi:sulfite reductase (NADPH) flavoprotein alpha-component
MTIPNIVPESAPFTDEQRSWLNGFLSGWLGTTQQAEPANDPEVDEDYPWHDETMPLEERMALAEGRPFEQQLMAAMGQQDCGQCGYLCDTYAKALASGNEADMNLCAPGGRDTRLVLKDLLAENAALIGGGEGALPQSAPVPGTRDYPVLATVLSATPLTGEGSCKAISHIAVDLSDTGLTYRAGDSLGVYATNDAELISEVLAYLGLSGAERLVIDGKPCTAQEALLHRKSLGEPSDELLAYLLTLADTDTQATIANALEQGVEEGTDVLDVLQWLQSFTGDAARVITSLAPLQPRLYSISSSPQTHFPEVHGTIAIVRYERGGRNRSGVASTYLGERCVPGTKVPVYIQPTADFLLPADPCADVIMIGPGTGIAPFRAFLHERAATGASGRNWLFFGNPNQATDYLYQEEFEAFQAAGVLTDISLAFSRDQAHKIYVQDRLRERGADVWKWLENGAYLYICGDATSMSAGVQAALHAIGEEYGGLSPEHSVNYFKELKNQHRFLKDVY